MLEKILGAKSKIRILRELFSNTERDFSMEDIVKATGMSYGTIHPAIGELVDSRIIVTKKIGRSNVYKVNGSHVLFPKLRVLLESEASAFTDIAAEFADNVEKDGIDNIILFGSIARGKAVEAGDIDLLIICSKPDVTDKIDQLAEKFLEKYDVVVSPICLPKKETKERLDKYDEFIVRAIDEGVFLYGDDSWLRK